MSGETFLSRWSRRKLASKAGPDRPSADAIPAEAGSPSTNAAATAGPVPSIETPPLPPVESLTPESDFTPFMRKDTDGALRQRALKTLFSDPRFNVMDGLDVYIDDYSKPDPLPEGWLEQLNQVARLGEYREPAPVDETQPPESPPAAGGATVAEGTPPTPVSTPVTEAGKEPSSTPGDRP